MSDNEIHLVLSETMTTGDSDKATEWASKNLKYIKKIRKVDDFEKVHIYRTDAEEKENKEIANKTEVKEYIQGKKLCTFGGVIIGLLIRAKLATDNAKKRDIIVCLKEVTSKKNGYAKKVSGLSDKNCFHSKLLEKIKVVEKEKNVNLSEIPGVDQDAIADAGTKGRQIKKSFKDFKDKAVGLFHHHSEKDDVQGEEEFEFKL